MRGSQSRKIMLIRYAKALRILSGNRGYPPLEGGG